VSDKDIDRPETPKGHVEILPPENEHAPSGGFAYSHGYGTIKIVKLGPVGSALLALAIGLMLIFGFLFLSGALLLLLPVLALLSLGAILSGAINNPFKRLR